jgi:hypothetical protein
MVRELGPSSIPGEAGSSVHGVSSGDRSFRSQEEERER